MVGRAGRKLLSSGVIGVLCLFQAGCVTTRGAEGGAPCGPMQAEAEEGGCRPLQAGSAQAEEVSFPSQESPGGRVQLLGTLTRPVWDGDDAGPELAPGVVLIGGSGPHSRRGMVPGDLAGPYGAPVPVLEDLALALTRAGYAVLRYDKRTCTAAVISECTYSGAVAQAATWDDLQSDVVAAARFLASQPGVDPKRLTLVGHSQGATLALEAAPELDGLRQLVFLGGAYYPIDATLARQINWQIDAFRGSMTPEQLSAAEEQLAAVESGLLAIREGYMPEEERFMGAPPSFWRAWIDASSRTPSQLGSTRLPILYLRGGEDQNAAAEDAAAFRAGLQGRKHSAVIELPGHTHALSRVGGEPHVSPAALDALIGWMAEER